MAKRSIEINYVDSEGNQYKKVAETDDLLFLAPFVPLDDGGIELFYSDIKVFDKSEPEYPLKTGYKYSHDWE